MSTRGCHWGGLFLIFTAFVGLWAIPARADKEVDVDSSSYSPNPVNISAGEYVVWVCTDNNGPYGIGSDTFAWFAGDIDGYGSAVGVQFLSAGNYGYYDYNFNNGVSGSIHVVANVAPTITITSPTNNAVFAAPASFNFTAVASDTDADGLYGLATFVGANLVSNQVAIPVSQFGITVAYTPRMTNSTLLSNLPAGTYTLSAMCADNANTTNSTSITITVQNSTAITLTPLTVLAGKFRFNVAGLTGGKTNIVQATTNIASSTNWVSLATNIAAGSTASFTNAVGPGRRFFRILQLP